jgi:exodeoxyribonuclease V gamma subunit
MLDLIVHSRTEELLEELAMRVDQGLGPLSQRVVIVPSKGLGRWLAQELARHTGLAAGLHLPFASTWLWELAQRVLPPSPLPERPEHAQHLLCALLAELPGFALADPRPELAPFRPGPAGEALLDGRRVELARQLADSFDSLLVYRPDWLLAWEQRVSAEDPWQARLWQRVAPRLARSAQGPRRLQELLERLDQPGKVPEGLPPRLSLFLPGALPASQFALFHALARHTPVDVYLLRTGRGPRSVGSPAVWVPGGEQNTLEQELDSQFASEGISVPEPPALTQWAPGRLGRLQRRLCHAELPVGELPASDPPGSDNSLSLHSCHSLWRETEVLHDELLRLFDTLPDLHPDQILVLVADLPAWAPAIEAVFGRLPAGAAHPALPYSLSRRAGPASGWPHLLDQLLGLPGERFEAETVLTLLRQPLMSECLGLGPDDLQPLRVLLGRSGIRWGLDPQQQAELGLPDADGQSWNTALERLLTGLAAPAHPGDDLHPWPGMAGPGLAGPHLAGPDLAGPHLAGPHLTGPCVPIAHPVPVSGEDTRRRLGALAGLLVRLARWQQETREPRPLEAWCTLCRGWLTDLLAGVDGESALGGHRLCHALERLAGEGGPEGLAAPMDIAAFRALLAPQLEASARAGQFLDGRITFGEMTALSAVPSRVLCLLGLNDGEFPRRTGHSELDLAATAPRPGDRDPRREDRLLFRQALLSAREVLYLSWCGRDARRNTERAPGSLVRDLLDGLAQPDLVGGVTVHEHPLQPFHPGLFDPDNPAGSYREDLAAAWVRRRQGLRARGGGLYTDGLPLAGPAGDPADAGETESGTGGALDLERLVSFWKNPARDWLRGRYRLRLDTAEEELPGRESFESGGLEGWVLREAGWRPLFEGVPEAEVRADLQARGLLPGGVLGEVLFRELCAGAATWRSSLASLLPDWDRITSSVAASVPIGQLEIRGTLDGITERGLRVELHVGSLNAGRQIAAWLRHLVLNLHRLHTGQPCMRTLLVGKDEHLGLAIPRDPGALLQPWLEPWGRPQDRGPVPFAPASSLAWLVATLKPGKDPRESLQEAWQGNPFNPVPGDGQDAWMGRAWGPEGFLATPALHERFAAQAATCLEGLLAHRRGGDTWNT